ncbi:MAG TPA: ThiF family adenylyltransferase, partial [Candidatus Corynebacterium gallistercoris]|nr:ThiF family adenylyltransferase [Candidatus Corynebacterium gallistercoris]
LEGIDILVDGSDTFATKFLAADAAEVTGTPLVWGSVLRFQGDVALWWTGPGAPDRGVGMRDLFPTQPDPDSVPDCATAGVLGVTTSVVAGLMATELIWFASGKDTSRIGTLLRYDATAGSITHFTVPRDPKRQVVTELSASAHGHGCAVRPANPAADVLADPQAAAIDVREEGEKVLRDFPFPPHQEHYHLPTSLWTEQPDLAETLLASITQPDVPTTGEAAPRTVWVYCASGKRSARFIESFADSAHRKGLELRNVEGGVNAWDGAVDNARFFP